MANRKYDYTGIHELVETFSGEMSIMQICETEGLPYRGYMAWRQRHGYEGRKRGLIPQRAGSMVEIVPVKESSPRADNHTQSITCKVGMEFPNGLRFEREAIDLDTLIEMLNKIRPALCLS